MSSYGKKSTGTPSVYSGITRSSANLHRSRSIKSLKQPWYKKPLIQEALFFDVQKSSMATAVFTLLLSIFTVITAIFDIYCYGMAAPGSTHYGYYFISYQFVYVGNRHVRNILVMLAGFSILLGLAMFVTSIMLISALRKEYEKRMVPWIYTFAVFLIFRLLAYLFFSIVNDLYFGYNITMCVLWTLFIIAGAYGWVLVYSLYRELVDLTRLEDLAHLRALENRHLDGHHAVPECFNSPIAGRLSTDDTSQHHFHDARGLKPDSTPTEAGPSTSVSFMTNISSIS